MRNNPKHGKKCEYTELFQKYTKVEKIRRFFNSKRSKIYKNFMMQPYHHHFNKKNAKNFVEQIDTLFKMAGKLVHFFIVEDHFHSLKEEDIIPFEHFYEVLVKWSFN